MRVTPQTSVMEFFKELVTGAVARQRITVSDEAAHYLVALLADAVRPDKSGAAASMLDDRPLAVRLADALQQERADKPRRLRELADATLLVSGFFAERLEHERVAPRYYHALGGFAYRTLEVAGGPLSATFRDLAVRFALYADVLLEVGHRTELTRSGRLLRLFEQWQRSGHAVTERLLIEQGVVFLTGRAGNRVQ
jgi:hypothetical protein